VRRWVKVLLVVLAVVGIGIGGLVTWGVRATPQIRERLVAALNERFSSQIDVSSLEVALLPAARVAGTGFKFRHNGRTDLPPLITLESFEASADIRGLLRSPIELDTVSLHGLTILVPPGGIKIGASAPDAEEHQPHPERPSPIFIDRITSKSARLEIPSRRPGRLPRIFDIHDLVMEDFGNAAGSPFSAGVMNPVPRGRVETTGTFGPWHADEPGLTPVRGAYTFSDADMNAIKGLGGTLSSVGNYTGLLQRIEVQGQTETPDFSLDISGNPVPLSTRFAAVVDGTNGDTFLEKVEATLGKTAILAKGAVVRTEDVKGRHVTLDVEIDRGRIEDLLALAVKAKTPLLTGRIDVATKMLLPSGEIDVIDRLVLEGSFRLAQARFSNVDVQKKIATLSLRGRGQEDAVPSGNSVVSNMGGKFVLRNARITFSELTFGVPGAVVELAGTYNLHNESIDFKGYLLTDASLADMTSGFKSVLARLAQPLFRRPGGGSKLPIRISGPRSKPAFGLDMGRVLKRS
jgi:hypothetical protein